MEVRQLRPENDRSSFTSGDADLDRFFYKFAGQNQFRHHIGVTYVAVEDGKISGYATVAAGHIEVENTPDQLRKRLPTYPLPVLRLARPAVATERQGLGTGRAMLFAVFQLALAQADSVGCLGVVVDAKPQAVSYYEQFGFIPVETVAGASAARPAPTPMFLALATIRAAAKAHRTQGSTSG